LVIQAPATETLRRDGLKELLFVTRRVVAADRERGAVDL